MSLDPKLHMKWLVPEDALLKGLSFTLSNMALLSAEDTSKCSRGLTVFDPRSFNEQFIDRLKARKTRPEFSSLKFNLYVPAFLKQHAEALLLKAEVKDVSVIYTPFLKISQKGAFFFVSSRMTVINVDDSPVLLKFLKRSFEELGFVDVVSQISDPLVAAKRILELKPDVVTMDIQMPGKTGVQVVQEVLAEASMPILMISSLNMEEGSLVFDALNAGAFDYLQKPKLEEKAQFQEDLKEKVLLATESSNRQNSKASRKILPRKVPQNSGAPSYKSNLVWCIGSSTGGTQALTRIFTSLPAHVPPTIIVQHIPPVFSKSFANSLNQLCPFTVKEAEHGEVLLPDHVYIAAGGLQLGLEQRGGKIYLLLKDVAPVNRFKPSVDFMFNEVAKLKDLKIVAGILTGMGKDGAAGLLALKKLGAQTFAQDEQSCAVFGMPRAAIELGAADTVAPLDELADVLLLKSSSFAKAG